MAFFDGDVIAGGNFYRVNNNIAANSIALWDGANWRPMNNGFNASVASLAVGNHTLYAAGSFTGKGTSSGDPIMHVASWNGKTWQSIGNGLTQTINTLTFGDDSLYAGGSSNNLPWVGKFHNNAWTALPKFHSYRYNTDASFGTINSLAFRSEALYAAGQVVLSDVSSYVVYNQIWGTVPSTSTIWYDFNSPTFFNEVNIPAHSITTTTHSTQDATTLVVGGATQMGVQELGPSYFAGLMTAKWKSIGESAPKEANTVLAYNNGLYVGSNSNNYLEKYKNDTWTSVTNAPLPGPVNALLVAPTVTATVLDS